MIIPTRKTDILARIPTRAHPQDAGSDLYALEKTSLVPGEWKLVLTGLEIEIPQGYVGLICPRAGLALNFGITVLNGPGVIDAGYQGPLGAELINLGKKPYIIQPEDRIAQLIVMAFEPVEFDDQAAFSISERGRKGFGSTGTSDR